MSTFAPALDWIVSPVADSGYYCGTCKQHWLDAEQVQRVLNRQVVFCACGEKLMRQGDVILGVRGDNAHFLDEANVRSTTWYHLTVSSDWDAFVAKGRDMVHLGTRETALARRAAVVDPNRERPVYLYEVCLTEDAVLTDEVFADEDSWPTQTNSCGSKVMGWQGFVPGVNRYVNAFEAHGSISLLVATGMVRILNRTEV